MSCSVLTSVQADLGQSRVADNVTAKRKLDNVRPEISKFIGDIFYKADGSIVVVQEFHASRNQDICRNSDVTMSSEESLNSNNNNCNTNQSDANNNINQIPKYLTFMDDVHTAHHGASKVNGSASSGFEPMSPKVRTFRVHALNGNDEDEMKKENLQRRLMQVYSDEEENENDKKAPVLMCFLCRLTFGFARSFVGHVTSKHNVTLHESETEILECKNLCAILQEVDHGNCIVCFLEPVTSLEGKTLDEHEVIDVTSSHDDESVKSEINEIRKKIDINVTDRNYNDKREIINDQVDGRELLNSKGNFPQSEEENDQIRLLNQPVSPSGETDQESGSQLSEVVDSTSQTNNSSSSNDNELLVLDLSNPSLKIHASGKSTSSSSRTKVSEEKMSFAVASPLGTHTSSPTSHKILMNSVIRAEVPLDQDTNGSMVDSPEPKNFSPRRQTPENLSKTQSRLANSSLSLVMSSSEVRQLSTPPARRDVTSSDIHPGVQEKLNVHSVTSSLPLGTSQQSNIDTIISNSANVDPMFPMSLFQSRNSCKTLKCPKCNWHYKYRQTLEAHMKEKHLEEASDCAYCNASQPHPRLSRGESYSCGYKPFKCNVCNYSTTTKGNLSIHMQSDKHLYNARTLQQRQQERMRQGAGTSTFHVPRQPSDVSSTQNENIQHNQLKRTISPTSSKSPSFNEHTAEKHLNASRRRRSSSKTNSSVDSGIFSAPSKTGSPSPGRRESGSGGKWRCEVCLYETGIARNLRIHMTSEKHAQNLALRERGLLNQPRQGEESTRQLGERSKPSDNQAMQPLLGHQGLMEYYAAAFKSLQPDGNNDVTGRGIPTSENAEKARKVQAQYLQQQLFIAQQQQLILAQQYQQMMMAAAASSLQQRLTSQSKDDDVNANLSLVQTKHQQMLMQHSQNQLWKQLFPHVQDLSHPTNATSMQDKDPSMESSKSTPPRIFSCGLCGIFGTDDVTSLESHVRKPRHCDVTHDLTNNEWVTRTQREGYFCKLCTYSTPLKTNFNLHCKTEKHTCKLNLISHVREGGAATEWMIPHIIRGNMTQNVSCNACQFSTHSFEKLKLHCSTDQHQGVFTVCQYLQTMLKSRSNDHAENDRSDDPDYKLKCLACGDYFTKHVVEMVQHMQTSEHQINLQNHKNPRMTTLQDVISIEDEIVTNLRGTAEEKQLHEEDQPHLRESTKSDDDKIIRCEYCNYVSDNKDRLRLHVMTQHSDQPPSKCPLCQELLKGTLQLQLHLVHVHNLQAPEHSAQNNTGHDVIERPASSEPTETEEISQKLNEAAKHRGDGEEDMPSDLVIDETGNADTNQDTIQAMETDVSQLPPHNNKSSPAAFKLIDDRHHPAIFNKQKSHQSDSLIMKVLKGQDITVSNKFAESDVTDLAKEDVDDQTRITRKMDSIDVPQSSKDDLTDPNSVFPEDSSMEIASRSCPNLVSSVNDPDSNNNRKTTILNFSKARDQFVQNKPKRIRMRSCPLDDGSRSRVYRHLLSNYGLEQARQYFENRSPENRNKARSFRLDKEERKWASISDRDPNFNDGISDNQNGNINNPLSDRSENKTSANTDGVVDNSNEQKSTLFDSLADGEGSPKACRQCGKEFTGLWVLKAHEEVAHGVCVPAQNIQKLAAAYSDQFWDRLRQAQASGRDLPSDPATLNEVALKSNQSMSAEQTYLNPLQFHGLQANSALSEKVANEELTRQQQQVQHQAILKALLSAQSGKPVGPSESNVPLSTPLERGNPDMYMSDPHSSNILSQMGIYSALFQAQAQALGLTPYQMLANAAAVQQIQQLNIAGSSMMGFSDDNQSRVSTNAFNNNNHLSLVPTVPTGGNQNRAAFDLLQKQEKLKQMQSSGQLQPAQSQPSAVEIPAKRPRTRITDDQLKILRANFDINNSPTEEQIDQMASRTCLPPKVIKHWFRNTLFKERQRSKDSPYNFNIPPIMSLEDAYKSSSVKEECPRDDDLPRKQSNDDSNNGGVDEIASARKKDHDSHIADALIESEERELRNNESRNDISTLLKDDQKYKRTSVEGASIHDEQVEKERNNNILKSSPHSGEIAEQFQQALFTNALALVPNLSPKQLVVSKQQTEQVVGNEQPGNQRVHSHDVLAQLPIPKQLMNPTAGWQALANFENNSNNDNLYYNESSSLADTTSFPHAQGSCRRTPRTRFTDFQLQVLQDFFDRNAYPKDDDLDKLSQTLNLSTRVIVVWFQNARQKARKSYEQQQQPSSGRLSPSLDLTRLAGHRLDKFAASDGFLAKTGTSGVEDLARKALNEVSKTISRKADGHSNEISAINFSSKETMNEKTEHPYLQTKTHNDISVKMSPTPHNADAAIPCQLCEKSFASPESWQVHQQEHLRANMASMFGQYGLIMQGLLGHQSQQQDNEKDNYVATPQDVSGLKFALGEREKEVSPEASKWESSQMNKRKLVSEEISSFAGFQNGRVLSDDKTMSSVIRSRLVTPPTAGSSKRKMSTSPTHSHSSSSSTSPATTQICGVRPKGPYMEEKESTSMHKDPKRLRTTITPEQLEYLYQQYLVDSSPSRKIIEQISEVVGLKKRVVQVWFQNTRARERKGQFRSSVARCVTGPISQYKLCHLCRMVFRSKADLDTHIQTRHAQQHDIDTGKLMSDEPTQKKAKYMSHHNIEQSAASNQSFDNSDVSDKVSNIDSNINMNIDAMKKLTAAMTQDPQLGQIKTEYQTQGRPHGDLANKDDTRESISIPRPFDYSSILGNDPNNPSTLELHRKLAALYGTSSTKDHSSMSEVSKSVSPTNSVQPLNIGSRQIPPDPPLRQSTPRGQPFTSSASATSMKSFTTKTPDSMNSPRPLEFQSEAMKPIQGSAIFNIQSNPSDLSHSPTSSPQIKFTPEQSQASGISVLDNIATPSKRYRTQMSSGQVKALKHCFTAYKTPSLAECDILGKEVGLQKRVIQVWFQNARAKEKKQKLHQHDEADQRTDYPDEVQTAKECDICYPVVRYSSLQHAREHTFSRPHLERLMKTMESDKRNDLATVAGINTSHSSPCSSYDGPDSQFQADLSGLDSPLEETSPVSYPHMPIVSGTSESSNNDTSGAHPGDSYTRGILAAARERGNILESNLRPSSADSDVNNNNRIQQSIENEQSTQQNNDCSDLLTTNPGFLQHYHHAVQQLMTNHTQDDRSSSDSPDGDYHRQQQAMLQQALQKSFYQMLKLPKPSPTGSQ